MLLFERTTRSLFLKLLSVGSPFLPTGYKALLSALLGVLLEAFVPSPSEEDDASQGGQGAGRQPLHVFHHPYPYQLFAAVVAFGLTFRANLAYSRYWEGRGSLASMGSKFAGERGGACVCAAKCCEVLLLAVDEAAPPSLKKL